MLFTVNRNNWVNGGHLHAVVVVVLKVISFKRVIFVSKKGKFTDTKNTTETANLHLRKS